MRIDPVWIHAHVGIGGRPRSSETARALPSWGSSSHQLPAIDPHRPSPDFKLQLCHPKRITKQSKNIPDFKREKEFYKRTHLVPSFE